MRMHPGSSRRAWVVAVSAGICAAGLLAPALSRGAGDDGRANPVPATAQSLDAGRRLYMANCADCHGRTGDGNGELAKDMDKQPSRLADPSNADESDDELFAQITRGRKPMPRFGKLLSERERWTLVNYVRTLAKPPGGEQPQATK